METYTKNVLDRMGNAIAGAEVTVFLADGVTKATLPSNPIVTDGNGMFSFTLPNGTYVISVQGLGIQAKTRKVTLFDPADAIFPTADEKASFPAGASAADPLAQASDARFPTADEKAAFPPGVSAASPLARKSETILPVPTIAALREITGTPGQIVYLAGRTHLFDGAAGEFAWDSSDLSASVTADTQSGIYVAPDSAPTGASGAWVRQFKGGVNIKWFGAVEGQDSTSAIQGALNASLKVYGSGEYIVSSTLDVRSNQTFRSSAGPYGLKFVVNTDFAVISHLGTSIFGLVIDGLHIHKTVSGPTSHYDIDLKSPMVCKIINTRVQSGHIDNVYSETNIGGIRFRKEAGVNASYMNVIDNCWIQNNSIHFFNITDSAITRSFIWGHTRPFTIRLEGATTGAIDISDNLGIICSRYNGGVWLSSAGINQIRITNNEFDGNPSLVIGRGVNATASATAVVVANNTFWGCGDHGIYATDPVAWSITGNNFWKGNAQDNFYDDIRIVGVNFQPSRNIVTGNTHLIDATVRNNPGYAYNEINAGFAPVSNIYANNTVTPANYNPALINSARKDNSRLITSGNSFDPKIQTASKSGTVAPNGGTLDLQIGVGTGDINIVGILYVSLVRANFPAQSRQSTYFVQCRGGAGTVTLMNSGDGASGGIPFTLALGAGNTVTLTNTSTDAGQTGAVLLTFQGILNNP